MVINYGKTWNTRFTMNHNISLGISERGIGREKRPNPWHKQPAIATTLI